MSNEHYRETNSLYSLWLAAQHLQGGAFVLNGDLVFTPLLLERLKRHPAPDALLFDSRRTLGQEEMKVRLAGRYVVDMSSQMAPDLADGENVGLLKFGDEGASRLTELLDRLVMAGELNAWAPRAIAEPAHRWPVVGIDADGLPWTEVDDPEDVDHADRVIAPAIEASLRRSAIDASPSLRATSAR